MSITFIGLTLILIPYKNQKKNIAFQKMSLEIVDNESKEQISMIGNYETDEEVKQEEQKEEQQKQKS